MAEPEANKKKKNAAAPETEAAGKAAGTPEAEKAAAQAQAETEAQAQTQSPPETPPAESAPADELAQLREENKALADRNLRLMAEFDNYRKRTQRERDAVYPEAVAGTLKEIIPVIDNFKRAMEASCSDESYVRGVQLIYQSLWEKLTALGVEELARPGDAFDPNLHEAVMHVEDEALGKNVIAQVLQQGYKVGSRVIRHAMVQVAN